MNITLDDHEQRLRDDVVYLAGGDIELALDLLVRCHAVSCYRVSAGFVRAGSLSSARSLPKTRVEALDIPAPESPEATTPA
ncbi:MAG: hypothetical protein KF810_16750 [Rhizobiaceae bacterium]|nr:hypothetical protein [Rhizobiaceae bacterium]